MTGLLSVDPGVHAHGVALWDDGRLVDAAYLRTETMPGGLLPQVAAANAVMRWLRDFSCGEELVVEVPRSYDVQNQKGDQNDLIALAVSVGVLVGTLGFPGLRLVTPQSWKGQVPKEVLAGRVAHALDAAEGEVLHAALEAVVPGERHNVWDATGIGLWALRRLHGPRSSG